MGAFANNRIQGAVLTVLSYSSLAIVLLTATLASQALLPVTVALGLVVGANLGSGLLAILAQFYPVKILCKTSPQLLGITGGTAGGLLLFFFFEHFPKL